VVLCFLNQTQLYVQESVTSLEDTSTVDVSGYAVLTPSYRIVTKFGI
jgi:hypothetical protein